MPRAKLQKPPTRRPKPVRSDAQHQGQLDGKRWAEAQAHPSELSRIGYWYEVNFHLGVRTSFRYRGPRPADEEFVAMIRPHLDGDELHEASSHFWGERATVIEGFGRFGLHYVKEFSDAALLIWLAIRVSWESLAYVRGAEAGQAWARHSAAPEELGRLVVANEANGSEYGGMIYWPNIDDPYRIAEIVLAPEPDGEEEDFDPQAETELKRKFWEPIIGRPFELTRFKLLERKFIIGFMDGVLGRADTIWSKF